MNFTRFLAVAALAVMLMAQTGREIPPTDDPTHGGQPSWCQRTDGGGYIHNCACKAMTDEKGNGMCDGEKREPHGDAMCKTYCRRSRCSCHAECENPTR